MRNAVKSHWVLALVVFVACGDDGGDGGVAPFFPDDYEASYMEVRNCRQSGDHDLNNIRILADPAGLSSYQNRDQDFPEGSVVVKEEYEFDDRDCAGAVKQWTVMRRLVDGSSSETLDWEWQKIDATGRVVEENGALCYGCHTGCGFEPDGFDGTCAVP